MNLNINFMIKDGHKVISTSQLGYKALFKKVNRQFDKVKRDIDITIIIQTSRESARNNRGKYYVALGKFKWDKREIVMYRHNCNNQKELKTFLAHELGHLHHLITDYENWCMSSVLDKERYADNFAEQITGVNPHSITGQVRSIAASKRKR